ncbi:MAG: hypothetical protein E7312_06320 [Clostridiales bacterium]|nr:hypothetical protein [Clostridiales bacterium]
MKLGIFTDSHYSSQEITCGNRYNSRSLEKIRQAYCYFEEEKCDLVICLGDLTDKESTHKKEVENLSKIAQVINNSPLKTICLMGNHDAFALCENEFYDILGLSKPELIEADGKTLIFIDACYFKSGIHYMPGDTDWTDTFYPHVKHLKKLIDDSENEVYIFIHQNLDTNIPQNHRLYNCDEINQILHESKKVKAVYQGHYHPGIKSKHGEINYVAFPAMCENENAYFIENI